jgi:hypothetical protein
VSGATKAGALLFWLIALPQGRHSGRDLSGTEAASDEARLVLDAASSCPKDHAKLALRSPLLPVVSVCKATGRIGITRSPAAVFGSQLRCSDLRADAPSSDWWAASDRPAPR